MNISPLHDQVAILLFLALLVIPLKAEHYILTVKQGSGNGLSPEHIGVGFSAHQDSNYLLWLKYLRPTLARVFTSPHELLETPNLAKWQWRDYCRNVQSATRKKLYGDQFGVSFSNRSITTEKAWVQAVEELRAVSRTPGQPAFESWLVSQNAINWSHFMRCLRTDAHHQYYKQFGSSEILIKQLLREGYTVLGLWAIGCENMNYTSINKDSPEYWKERYETYRLNYIGSRWLCSLGVNTLELVNEPDIHQCFDPRRWIDDVRIRSMAATDAYQDHASQTNTAYQKPYLISGSLAHIWLPEYAEMLKKYVNRPFRTNTPLASYKFLDSYSFHKYGTFSYHNCTKFGSKCHSDRGEGVQRAYEGARRGLDSIGLGGIPAVITEMNCYGSRVSDLPRHPYFQGRHIMDRPETAACVASQLGWLMQKQNSPGTVVLHRITQSYNPWKPSHQTKNGFFYVQMDHPFHITGSTKSAEAVRLVASHGTGRKHVVGFVSGRGSFSDIRSPISRLIAWAIAEENAVYVYIVNEGWVSHDITLQLGAFNPANGSYAVVNAVGLNKPYNSTYHGEVSDLPQAASEMALKIPEGTTLMLAIPTVTTTEMITYPAAATTLTPIAQLSAAAEMLLSVSSSTAVSVAALKFDSATNISPIMVTATLQLRLLESTNIDPQILTVLALADQKNWENSTLNWSSVEALLPLSMPPKSTADNFINWKAASLTIAGHMTVPPSYYVQKYGGADLRLDVTDLVREGKTSFLILRMVRHDASKARPPAQVPADHIQGVYTFASNIHPQVEWRPQLRLQVAATASSGVENYNSRRLLRQKNKSE